MQLCLFITILNNKIILKYIKNKYFKIINEYYLNKLIKYLTRF